MSSKLITSGFHPRMEAVTPHASATTVLVQYHGHTIRIIFGTQESVPIGAVDLPVDIAKILADALDITIGKVLEKV